MALSEFVRNVQDVSDDGGYKFRFHCDRCNDGVESQYLSSASNILKTGLEIFNMFRPFGYGADRAVQGIDRGLRGKERDRAYEKAVNEARVHFNKCSHCGAWVCAHCFNQKAGLCEGCAPDASEAAAKAAAQVREKHEVEAVRAQGLHTTAQVTCPVCLAPSGAGKFCEKCGASLVAQRKCAKCSAALSPTAKFCGECGNPA